MNPKLAQNYVIYSSNFPSGVTWLLNVLLELEICIYCEDFDNFWSVQDGTFILHDQQRWLYKWLPTLCKKNKYSFKEPIKVAWTHDWLGLNSINEKAIFFTRNGFDATYSHFKRGNHQIEYDEFLSKPFVTNHTPHGMEFGVTPQEYWALHSGFFLRQLPKDALLLHFEERDLFPMEMVTKTLEYLTIHRSDPQIKEAILNSTVEKAKEGQKAFIQLNMQGKNFSNQEVIRSGKKDEWKGLLNQDQMRKFEGLPLYIINKLGYQYDEFETIEYKATEEVLSIQKQITDNFLNGIIILEEKIKSHRNDCYYPMILALFWSLKFLKKKKLEDQWDQSVFSAFSEMCLQMKRSLYFYSQVTLAIQDIYPELKLKFNGQYHLENKNYYFCESFEYIKYALRMGIPINSRLIKQFSLINTRTSEKKEWVNFCLNTKKYFMLIFYFYHVNQESKKEILRINFPLIHQKLLKHFILRLIQFLPKRRV